MSVESCQHAKVIQDSATKMKSSDATEFAMVVDQIRSSIGGELIGRAAAIDHLLDLRSALRHRPELVQRIDAVLVEVPGQRTVAAAWLGVVVTDVERLVSLAEPDADWSSIAVVEPAGAPPPPTHRSDDRLL